MDPKFFSSQIQSLSSFDKIKSEYLLGLDIGTEAVKAIIFQKPVLKKEEKAKLIIWGKYQEYFDKSNVFNSGGFEERGIKVAISESIKGVHQNFIQNLGRKINIHTNNLPALVSLPPNILKEKIISQSLERENPDAVISKKEESDIYKIIFKNTQDEIAKNFFQEFGILTEDIHFISLRILEIKFDGYKISKLEGFKGKRLDFRVLTTFSLKGYLKNIEKILKDLKLNILEFLYKSQNLPRLFFNEESEAIFLDVGGEVSQVFLIKKGKIELVFEFNSGGLDFTERLSKILGLNLEDSRNLKHNYSNLLLSEEVRKKVREILSEERQSWFENLKKAFRNVLLGQRILLPSNIFIFGGGSLLPEIQEALEEGNWEDLPFFSRPKAKLLYPKDLKIIEDKTKGLISPQDINLILGLTPFNKDSLVSV
jgi:cell division ATPase FtsA